MTSAAPRSWSVALSGGGHRASLFAAGVLLYLVDSGENADVSSIASVSGGSITNGLLAHAPTSFDTLDGEALRAVFKKLIRCCAVTGTVQYAREAKLVITAALAGLAGVVLGVFWCALDLWGGRGYGAIVLVASVLLFLACYESISGIADRVLNRLFFDSSLLRDVTSRVTHIFCTTELQSKLHLHLSQRFVYNADFAQAPVPTGPLRLSTAVQASACFPPVFPTRKFRASKAGLPTSFARRVWLADGGVYDNMGDEWARGYQQHASASHAEPGFQVMGPIPQRLLVVNASTSGHGSRASWVNRIPLLGDLYAIKAETDVMYKETTATRRADMWAQFDLARQLAASANPLADSQLGGSLLHIATSATWPHTTDRPRPAGTKQANWEAARTGLTALTDAERTALEDAAVSATGVGTTLAAVGRDRATDLLWHGYMLAMVNFVVFEGHRWAWRDRRYFADLTA